MASIKRVYEDSVNRENSRLKLAKYSAHMGPANKKRAAFIEVGNQLPNFQKSIEESAGFKQCKAASLPFKETKKIFSRIIDAATTIPRQQGQESDSSYLSLKGLSIIDLHNPPVESEYVIEMLNHLRSLEEKYAIQEGFLEGNETNPRMRTILVKWLIQVHARFDLDVETLHICVATTDRYLQANKHVGRNFLQLIGTTALLVACKYEEVDVPAIEDLVSMCESAFSKKHFLTMEVQIMKKLNHSFGRPTAVKFLEMYNEVACVSDEHGSMGNFILELVLVEYELSHVKPSLQAAAACCLSMGILDEVMDLSIVWTPSLVHYTSYEYDDLKGLVVDLAVLVNSKSSKFRFIRTKYASPGYDSISSNPKLNGPLVRELTIPTPA